MWCLVSQPNCIVLEVEVDPKADGQECLDKVRIDFPPFPFTTTHCYA